MRPQEVRHRLDCGGRDGGERGVPAGAGVGGGRVVLQNAVALNNRSETHPWHLHGHDFRVLVYGEVRFAPGRGKAGIKFNLRDPVMKNTVALHPVGWTAVRFVADNHGDGCSTATSRRTCTCITR